MRHRQAGMLGRLLLVCHRQAGMLGVPLHVLRGCRSERSAAADRASCRPCQGGFLRTWLRGSEPALASRSGIRLDSRLLLVGLLVLSWRLLCASSCLLRGQSRCKAHGCCPCCCVGLLTFAASICRNVIWLL